MTEPPSKTESFSKTESLRMTEAPTATGVPTTTEAHNATKSPTTVQADDNTRQSYDQVLVDVIKYVYHYQIDSSKAWSCAKLALLDAMGCVLETLVESEEARAMIGPVVVDTIVPNGFRLPGTSYQMDPLKGAFDLGSLIRYLDHNDAFPGAEWGHPSGQYCPWQSPAHQ